MEVTWFNLVQTRRIVGSMMGPDATTCRHPTLSRSDRFHSSHWAFLYIKDHCQPGIYFAVVSSDGRVLPESCFRAKTFLLVFSLSSFGFLMVLPMGEIPAGEDRKSVV